MNTHTVADSPSQPDQRFVWSEVRDHAIERFGDAPRAETEFDVVEHFERRPRLVVDEIRRVGDDLANGKIRSGWPILRSRLAGAASSREAVVVDGSERERAVVAAEKWIRGAGAHFDRWEEVEAALFDGAFGDHGQSLRAWRADDALRARLFDLWADLRPRAEELEADALERAARWRETYEPVRRDVVAVRASGRCG